MVLLAVVPNPSRPAALNPVVKRVGYDLTPEVGFSSHSKSGPGQRWWIDAAIQQIEEELPKNRKPRRVTSTENVARRPSATFRPNRTLHSGA